MKKIWTATDMGRKGGKARSSRLSKEQRQEIARKGGLAGGRGRGKKNGKISDSP